MFEIQTTFFDNTPPKKLTWRERYQIVISSERWKRLRLKLIEKNESKCSRCGWQKNAFDKSRNLELHHKTYERLGEERESDLEIVCSICHVKADKERAIKGQIKSAQAMYDAQFEGWATSVYGEGFDDFENESIHDRFQRWQERKNEEDN